MLFLGRYQHRPQHLFGGIGTLLILIGVLVELYLTVDKLVFGHPIGQRPLLLLGALLIIVGVQLLSLGLIGELIANSRARGGPDAGAGGAVVEAAAGEVGARRAAPDAGPPRGRRPADAAVAAAASPRAPPTRRDPRRRLLRHVRPGLPAQRRAHRRAARARRRRCSSSRRRCRALTAARDGDAARRRAARRRRRRGPRAAASRSIAPRCDVDAVVVGYPGHFLVPFGRAARRRSGARGSCSTRSSRCGTRSPATAAWSPPAAGRPARPCAPSTALAFALPDLVLADTWAHAAYYQAEFGARRVGGSPWCRWARCRSRAPTGARAALGAGEPLTVFQYGKWSPLHGAETVLAAAELLRDEPFRFVLAGEGQLSARAARRRSRARGLDQRRVAGRAAAGGAARPHAGRRRLPRRVRRARTRRRAWCPTRSTTRWPAAGRW